MPLSIVNNTCQVELVYNWQGQICENVLHYTKVTEWNEETLFDIADSVAAAYAVNHPTAVAAECTLFQIIATDLGDLQGPQVVYDGILPIVGVASTPTLPNNVSVAITKRTAKRGRSFRGRIYHVGLAEGFVTGNAVTVSAMTGILAAWNNMLTFPISGEDALLSVVSRIQNGIQIDPAESTPVTALTSDGVVDSQRRRLPGRGN